MFSDFFIVFCQVLITFLSFCLSFFFVAFSDASEVDDGPVTGWGGHATQILWKSTTELGCAVSTCDGGGFTNNVLVCNYNPP